MLRSAVILSAGVLTAAMVYQPAQADTCANPPHWTNTTPKVNYPHIFCGEYSGGKPKGFHSRPGAKNPSTVASVKDVSAVDANGLYSLRWSYTGHASQFKFSTMYPDSCTEAEVIKSITHATTDKATCPSGSPSWASCGYNRPASSTTGYCVGKSSSTRFVIGYATLSNGNVNTAFPLQ